jgi:peroxiredoxin
MRMVLLPGLLALLALPACKDGPSPAAAPRREAPSSQPKAKAPPMKQSVSPATERVGILPDGVGITVGSTVPEVTLTGSDGQAVQLKELRAQGPLLVVFYRGGWCPFCNFQVRELTAFAPALKERGVTPVVISVDRVEEGAKTSATYSIPFPVLSDPELLAHEAFRVMQKVSDEEVERLAGFGMDLEGSSGKVHHTLAIPSLFLVDMDGKVRWAHAERDYKLRPSMEQILAAIDAASL